MIRLAILLAAGASQTIAPSRGSVIDWQGLPMLPYRADPAVDAGSHLYVRQEAMRHNCPVYRLRDGSRRMQADVAILLGPNGRVRTAIPRAIHCPTVEQFAAGFVASSTRENLRRSLLPPEGGWYRATLVFAWRS